MLTVKEILKAASKNDIKDKTLYSYRHLPFISRFSFEKKVFLGSYCFEVRKDDFLQGYLIEKRFRSNNNLLTSFIVSLLCIFSDKCHMKFLECSYYNFKKNNWLLLFFYK